METKRNLNYFIAPPISIATLIGLIISVVAIVLIFFPSTRIIGIIALIIGLGIAVFTSGGKATDTDIEFQAVEFTKDLEEDSMKKNEVYEKNFLKTMKPLHLTGFDFDESLPDFHYRRGRDGTHRTNYYMGASLIFTSEKVYIYSRHFSLTDESHNEVNSVSYKYSDLSHSELEERTFKGKAGKLDVDVPLHIFKLFNAAGECVFKMYINYGADSDLAVENVNRTINVRSEELRKLAEEKARKIEEFRAKVAKEAEEDRKKAKTQQPKNEEPASSNIPENVEESVSAAEEVVSAEEPVFSDESVSSDEPDLSDKTDPAEGE